MKAVKHEAAGTFGSAGVSQNMSKPKVAGQGHHPGVVFLKDLLGVLTMKPGF